MLNFCDQSKLETIEAKLRYCNPVQKLGCLLTCSIFYDAELLMLRKKLSLAICFNHVPHI